MYNIRQLFPGHIQLIIIIKIMIIVMKRTVIVGNISNGENSNNDA